LDGAERILPLNYLRRWPEPERHSKDFELSRSTQLAELHLERRQPR